jgi:hypothetical protein
VKAAQADTSAVFPSGLASARKRPGRIEPERPGVVGLSGACRATHPTVRTSRKSKGIEGLWRLGARLSGCRAVEAKDATGEGRQTIWPPVGNDERGRRGERHLDDDEQADGDRRRDAERPGRGGQHAGGRQAGPGARRRQRRAGRRAGISTGDAATAAPFTFLAPRPILPSSPPWPVPSRPRRGARRSGCGRRRTAPVGARSGDRAPTRKQHHLCPTSGTTSPGG